MTTADVSASYSITRDDLGAELKVGQTIWDGYGSPIDGGKGAASLKQSALSLQVKELSAETSRQGVISKIKQAYYALLSAQHTVTVRREAFSQQQAQYERTKARAEAQLATSLELRQAEINARSAELDLAAAEAALTASRRTLSLAAGWPGDRLYTVAEAPDPVAPALDIPALVATAMEKRIDVRQQKLERRVRGHHARPAQGREVADGERERQHLARHLERRHLGADPPHRLRPRGRAGAGDGDRERAGAPGGRAAGRKPSPPR